MEIKTKRIDGESSTGYRAFGFDQSRADNFDGMGKIIGDALTIKKTTKIKSILMDKRLFPKIESVEINAEDQGFGYVSISFLHLTRRSHIHWYELTLKILAPAIVDDPEEYYRRVFIKKEDPVHLLYHFYKTQQNEQN